MTARRDWAGNRLHAVDATRRMLVVESDGCPMDGATALANGVRYLDAHLEAGWRGASVKASWRSGAWASAWT